MNYINPYLSAVFTGDTGETFTLLELVKKIEDLIVNIDLSDIEGQIDGLAEILRQQEIEMQGYSKDLDGISDDIDDLRLLLLGDPFAVPPVRGLKDEIDDTADLIKDIQNALAGVMTDLADILGDPQTDTLTGRVDEVADAIDDIRDAANRKGANILSTTPLDEYDDKIDDIITAGDSQAAYSYTASQAYRYSVFDIVIPPQDADGNTITAFGPLVMRLPGSALNPPSSTNYVNSTMTPFVRSIRAPQQVTSIISASGGSDILSYGPFVDGTNLDGTVFNLELLDFPGVTSIPNNCFLRVFSTKPLVINLDSITGFSVVGRWFAPSAMTDSFKNVTITLNVPKLKQITITSTTSSIGYGRKTSVAVNAPLLETFTGTTGSASGHLALGAAGTYNFSSLSTITGYFCTCGVDNTFYLPSLTSWTTPAYGGVYCPNPSASSTTAAIYDVDVNTKTFNVKSKLYIGGGLATMSTRVGTSLASAISYGGLEIHIPAGESTTKDTLDGAGVTYTQDYNPATMPGV